MSPAGLKKTLLAPGNNFSGHLVKSAVSSALGFGMDFGSLFVLVEKLRIFYLVAALASFVIGTSVVFILSRYWVFPTRRFKKGAAQYTVFLFFAAIGVILNLFIIWFVTETFGLHYLISKILSGLLVFCFNFATRKYFIFSGGKAAAES